MEKEVEARFERIERNLECVTERLDVLTDRIDRTTEAHIDLEAAWKKYNACLESFIEEMHARRKEVEDRSANLTILVDRLIERGLRRN